MQCTLVQRHILWHFDGCIGCPCLCCGPQAMTLLLAGPTHLSLSSAQGSQKASCQRRAQAMMCLKRKPH